MLDQFVKSVNRSFVVRWRGYDRLQVDSAFGAIDQEMAFVRLDRDAALSTAEDVTRLILIFFRPTVQG